jgi:hypothetical protein
VTFDADAGTVTVVGVVGGAAPNDGDETVAVERLTYDAEAGILSVDVVTQSCGMVGDGEFEVTPWEVVVRFPEGLPDALQVLASEDTARGIERVAAERD